MAAPAWTRERSGRMEAARSLLRPSPAPSPQRSRADLALHYTSGSSASEPPAAMWASPSAARVRSRPSNLHAAVRASPSFPLSQRPAASASAAAATPLRTSVQRAARHTAVQSRTTQSTQTETGEGHNAAENGGGIHLGAFGEVAKMTAETVDFLIRVLEDVGVLLRKQELLVSGEDRELRVKARYAAEGDNHGSEEAEVVPASEVARLQLDSAKSGGAGVTELVRSHSYETLVQLEGILEARHNKLMNDGFLETEDDVR
ncbi:hypothetical protein PHYSODRAFT_245962 [Phytophthora sojae]|uniref:Uncharacterized protein n=1 Tax=Phytophthora sojae (strain P6497) TaxID=1094619 RepID=G4Z7G2_PHYSP|nr:hypothetical protein PHYSODRAFT_245962 [Phytophthora sojae]EGZ20365.1 hypothetical protein PHYSODRAFT_245962 [Phytophthora sojae]|eukprot:XP_009523082.1 hypothetical protein PHYSODRAFT_245962 [Phytophthora sojae]